MSIKEEIIVPFSESVVNSNRKGPTVSREWGIMRRARNIAYIIEMEAV